MKKSDQILKVIRSEALNSKTSEVVYATEWLGYLPFGQYHWVTVDGVDVSDKLPDNFDIADLAELVDNNSLELIADSRVADDETDYSVTYRIC